MPDTEAAAGQGGNLAPSDKPDTKVTEDQAKLIEEEVRRLWDYVEKAFEDARKEANNTLQWLFAVTAGGIGLAASFFDKPIWPIGWGLLLSSGYSAVLAYFLLKGMASRPMQSPGYPVSNVSTEGFLKEPLGRLRWLFAKGLDDRIEKNRKAVNDLALTVDRIRTFFSAVPAIFVAASGITWLISLLANAIAGHLTPGCK